jgi:hypothetical protein
MTNSLDAPGNASAGRWQTHAPCDLSELAQARVEAINLVQWLARIANSYVAESPPRRRTSLEFRPEGAAIVTKPFDKAVALELRLPTLQMQFLDNGNPVPHVFDPEDHSPAEAEAWILVELLHRGVDREKFSKELPYAVPGLMSGDAEDYSPQLCRAGLIQLTALFQDAAAVLDAAARAAGRHQIRIVCLPQTLNLTTLPGHAGVEAGEFGFSPGDVENPEPYFYVDDGVKNGSAGSAKRSVLKASTLITESDPVAAAIKLKKLKPA